METKLQKEIDALKGRIQGLVYVPEYAGGEVRFTTLFVYKDYTNLNSSNLSDWTLVVSMNEVNLKITESIASGAQLDGITLVRNLSQLYTTATFNALKAKVSADECTMECVVTPQGAGTGMATISLP